MKFLKRFPESKHEQIKQLMSYIQLCGVTGKDLVSIGGHIDRTNRAENFKKIQSRINDFTFHPVGEHDRKLAKINRWHWWNAKWAIITPTGRYVFDSDYWGYVFNVTNTKTKVRNTFTVTGNHSEDFTTSVPYIKKCAYEIMMDVADGHVVLNF